MDVNEILSATKENISKRKMANSSDIMIISEKHCRHEDQQDSNDELPMVEKIDEHVVKKMIVNVEKKINKNQELRLKYANSPEKFMESEVELYEDLEKFIAISTYPEYFHIVSQTKFDLKLISLILHDNIDIGNCVVRLFIEMTDYEDSEDNKEVLDFFIATLINHDILPIIVNQMNNYVNKNEQEEDILKNCFDLIDNLNETNDDISKLAADSGLIEYLLKFIAKKIKEFNHLKLYAIEILSILLQNNVENRSVVNEYNGIDILLNILYNYVKSDPNSSEEIEYTSNVFECLCLSLSSENGKQQFLNSEGVQLMILMIRNKKLSRYGSIKVLESALSGQNVQNICNKIVTCFGLKCLGSLFIKPLKSNKKISMTSEEFEELVISIMDSLSKNLQGFYRQRFIMKFMENDFFKVDRLIELFIKYYEKLLKADLEINKTVKRMMEEGSLIDEFMENEFIIQRMNGGLYCLQKISTLIASLTCDHNDNKLNKQIKQHFLTGLSQHGIQSKIIRNVLADMLKYLNDPVMSNSNESCDEGEPSVNSKSYLQTLIDNF